MAFEDHVPINAFSKKYVFVDHECIVFDDTEMLAKEVSGFAYGGIVIEKAAGLLRKTQYVIRLADRAGDEMKITFFDSILDAEYDPESVCYHIVNEIWQSCGNRLLNETISAISRGYHEQFGDVTLSQKGVYLCEQKWFSKDDPKLYDWDDINANVSEGILTVHSISHPKARASFELPTTLNAHILKEIFVRRATQPDFMDVLMGKVKL